MAESAPKEISLSFGQLGGKQDCPVRVDQDGQRVQMVDA